MICTCTLLPCRWAQWVRQPTCWQVKPGLSSKAFLYQTLVLATIGYREEQWTETPFLRKTVLLPCFMPVFSEQHGWDTLLQLFHYLSDLASSSGSLRGQHGKEEPGTNYTCMHVINGFTHVYFQTYDVFTKLMGELLRDAIAWGMTWQLGRCRVQHEWQHLIPNILAEVRR